MISLCPKDKVSTLNLSVPRAYLDLVSTNLCCFFFDHQSPPLDRQVWDSSSSVSPAIDVGPMPSTWPVASQALNENAVAGLQLILFHKMIASDLFFG